MSFPVSRRSVLKTGAGVAAAAPFRAPRSGLLDALAGCATGSLRDVEHIIILIQENRSFDHYFGSYKGVRGFDDRSAPGGIAAFRQGFHPTAGSGLPNPMLPFHIDTAVHVPPQQGTCTNDVEHQWAGQHDSWAGGANDNWLPSHLATEPDPRQAALTMGYYTRADLDFYYALADSFTICDNYYCSVIAGTDVNRLYSMTGTLDPDGWDGGLQFLSTKVGTIENPGADLGRGRRWVPYPEVLQRAGISWKVYGTTDGQSGDNVLRYFPQFRPVGGDPALAQAAFGSEAFPADFAADCLAGTLPQVSWLLPGLADSEHAPDPLQWGESIVHTTLTALANSGMWKSSALFITYDENGGFFDHVTPPTPPRGTPGEYLDQAALSPTARKEATTVKGVDLSAGPIGLGFRVPMLVVSPFTRNATPDAGPLVCSDPFDHTSLLRFVETWSIARGNVAPVPNRDPVTKRPGLSPWRRAAVGDLTAAFNFAAPADSSVPSRPLALVPNRADPRVLTECTVTRAPATLVVGAAVQDPTIPAATAMPTQEVSSGPVQRPSGVCAASVRTQLAPAPGPARGSGAPAGSLPATGGDPPRSALAGAAVAFGVVAVMNRRRREREAQPVGEAEPLNS